MNAFLNASLHATPEGEFMTKFELDLSVVQEALHNNPNIVPVSGNEHRMVRVAFDLFRLKDDKSEDLWQIQADDDGEFLVRTYSLPEEEDITATSSEWSVDEDEKHANLTVSYKGIPLQRLAAKEYGANSPEDAFVLRGVVLEKLSSDKGFALGFFNSLPELKKNILKAAGFIDKLKEWLTSQDITDDLMEKIMATVEESEPRYKEMFEKEKLEKGEVLFEGDVEEDCVDEVSKKEMLETKVPFAARLSALKLELTLNRKAQWEEEGIEDLKINKEWDDFYEEIKEDHLKARIIFDRARFLEEELGEYSPEGGMIKPFIDSFESEVANFLNSSLGVEKARAGLAEWLAPVEKFIDDTISEQEIEKPNWWDDIHGSMSASDNPPPTPPTLPQFDFSDVETEFEDNQPKENQPDEKDKEIELGDEDIEEIEEMSQAELEEILGEELKDLEKIE